MTVYANPLPPGSGAWYLSAWASQGASWTTQPVLTWLGINYAWGHPAGYIEALKQLKSAGQSGSLDLFISQFQSVLSSWPPYTVVNTGPSSPTVSSYYWNNTPTNRLNFSGNVSGTGFVSGGTAVYFCQTGTTTCWPQPAVGIAINSSISLSVYNMRSHNGIMAGESRNSVRYRVRTCLSSAIGRSAKGARLIRCLAPSLSGVGNLSQAGRTSIGRLERVELRQACVTRGNQYAVADNC